MKKTCLAVALVASGVLFVTQAQAADGTITFNGNITTQSCVIDGGGTGTPNFSVDLPSVTEASLSEAGATSGSTGFRIVVGHAAHQCTATRVRTSFESSSSNVDFTTGYLKNTSGDAGNVQVLVANDQGKVINLRDNTNSQEVVPVDGIAELNYQAAYVAVGGAASVGSVGTNIQYSITYP